MGRVLEIEYERSVIARDKPNMYCLKTESATPRREASRPFHLSSGTLWTDDTFQKMCATVWMPEIFFSFFLGGGASYKQFNRQMGSHSQKLSAPGEVYYCPKIPWNVYLYVVIYWNAVRPAHTSRETPRFSNKTQIRRYFERYCYLAFETLVLTASFSQSSRGISI